MKKLIRKIRRFLFLSNSRLLSQIKVFQFLDNEDELTKSERNTMIWYFKKMLLKDLNRFGQIDKAIEILKESEKERKEKEKTSEEVATINADDLRQEVSCLRTSLLVLKHASKIQNDTIRANFKKPEEKEISEHEKFFLCFLTPFLFAGTLLFITIIFKLLKQIVWH